MPAFHAFKNGAPRPPVGANEADFREEILGMIYQRGQDTKARDLVFEIAVSDEGERTLLQQVKGQQWTAIGRLTFKQAVASYNGDFLLHFHHPPWRNDRNNRNTVARADLRPR